MSKIVRLLGSMAFSPILWGIAATVLFFAPLQSGAWSNPVLVRYLVQNDFGQIVTCMFMVGVATLATRYLGILNQHRMLTLPFLDAIPHGGQPLHDSDVLLCRLDEHSAPVQETYLVRRLRDVLEYVYRKNSAETMEAEMRHLALVDRSRVHAGYSFVRHLLLALVAAGAIGTVVTTTTETAFNGESFALALTLGTVLLFATHYCEKAEGRLVTAVDTRVSAELVGRFQPTFNAAADPQVAVLRGIAEQVLHGSEQLVTRQTELWKSAFVEAQRQWNDWSSGASRQMQDALATTLSATMQSHAVAVASAAEQNVSNWNDIQQALLQNAEAVTLQQQELVRQGEVLTQVISATGQVEKLENELNRNLSTLAGAKNFEQTVLSLGASIQLLNSKLGALPMPETPRVELKPKRKAA